MAEQVTVYFKIDREDLWRLKRLAADLQERGVSAILRRLVAAKLAEKKGGA